MIYEEPQRSRSITFRVTDIEMAKIKINAMKYTKGKISVWLRYSAMNALERKDNRILRRSILVGRKGLINFRVTQKEYETIIAKAKCNCCGNMSEWLRIAGTTFLPKSKR